ncbi:hypothetical protein [Desulfoplanes formicivorans]|uniref:Uncharacterized protein n=1 Tax=Desulfoplanes formicivorans TaxID=1592317 RepID=A0A194AHI7_9BACT|nr:hypothetical protein [Desulfoplanes formicivorans]GAU08546.1 hypothetical protein DPF_1258 [Desulfoplanes formicivorans]
MNDKNLISILVMRDDKDVYRVRMHPWCVKALIYGTILVGLCAVLGGYGVFYFWNENKQLDIDLQNMQNTLLDNNMELKRLRNIEKMQQYDVNGSAALDTKIIEIKNNNTDKSYINLNDIFGSIDKNVLIASNVQAKFIKKFINLSFDINKRNFEDNGVVNGNVVIHIVSSSGDVVDVETRSDMFFELRRMKQYNVRIPIPKQLVKNDIFGIRITINQSPGKTVFRETYLLSNILL